MVRIPSLPTVEILQMHWRSATMGTNYNSIQNDQNLTPNKQEHQIKADLLHSHSTETFKHTTLQHPE